MLLQWKSEIHEVGCQERSDFLGAFVKFSWLFWSIDMTLLVASNLKSLVAGACSMAPSTSEYNLNRINGSQFISYMWWKGCIRSTNLWKHVIERGLLLPCSGDVDVSAPWLIVGQVFACMNIGARHLYAIHSYWIYLKWKTQKFPWIAMSMQDPPFYSLLVHRDVNWSLQDLKWVLPSP